MKNKISNRSFGNVLYKGQKYVIYIPLDENDNRQYKILEEVRLNSENLNLMTFISGDFENDPEGITLQLARKTCRIESLQFALGMFMTETNNLYETYIDFVFQSTNDGYRRVTIKVGSDAYNRKISKYATETSISAYWNKNGFQEIDCCLMSDSSAILYSIITGLERDREKIYDIEVTIDEKHKVDPYYAYLWIDSNGNTMEYPILYPNDKVEFGTKDKYYFGDKFKALFRFNLKASRKSSASFL